MKKSTSPASVLTPFFEKIEELSKLQRLGIFIGILLALLSGFGYFSVYPKLEQIDSLKSQLAQAQLELNKAKQNAAQLNEWRSKMITKEAEYREVMRALPESAEIPSLLAGISQAGKDAGLEFLLFQPKAEIRQEFFAEIPVDINVSGSYHQVAVFFEKVSNLPRIVNIRDIRMTPQAREKSETLTTSCQAVTYKFIDAPPIQPKGVKKSKTRK